MLVYVMKEMTMKNPNQRNTPRVAVRAASLRPADVRNDRDPILRGPRLALNEDGSKRADVGYGLISRAEMRDIVLEMIG